MHHGRIEHSMQQVLIQLALTSNGRTASYGGRSSGGDNTSPILTLDPFDAPQVHFEKAWNRAGTDSERQRVYDSAVETLYQIRRSASHVQIYTERPAELAARIIDYGVGLEPYDVALAAKCTATRVREVRREHGRDEEWGRPNRNGREMKPAERKELVIKLHTEQGMSSRQIARHLRISPSTVGRDLGWST